MPPSPLPLWNWRNCARIERFASSPQHLINNMALINKRISFLSFLLSSIFLSGCASTPSDWLFSKQTQLKAYCGKSISSTLEILFQAEVQDFRGEWATHLMTLGSERIFLRFENNFLIAFEPFFDIPGRAAAASIGRYQCSDRKMDSP